MFAQLAQLEGPVLLWIQENLRGTLDWLVSLYTQLGNAGLLWIALSLAMLAWKPTRRAGLTALAAMVFGLLVTNLTIKPLLSRWRSTIRIPSPPDTPVPLLPRRSAGAAGCPGNGREERRWPWPYVWACPDCMWGCITPAT